MNTEITNAQITKRIDSLNTKNSTKIKLYFEKLKSENLPVQRNDVLFLSKWFKSYFDYNIFKNGIQLNDKTHDKEDLYSKYKIKLLMWIEKNSDKHLLYDVKQVMSYLYRMADNLIIDYIRYNTSHKQTLQQVEDYIDKNPNSVVHYNEQLNQIVDQIKIYMHEIIDKLQKDDVKLFNFMLDCFYNELHYTEVLEKYHCVYSTYHKWIKKIINMFLEDHNIKEQLQDLHHLKNNYLKPLVKLSAKHDDNYNIVQSILKDKKFWKKYISNNDMNRISKQLIKIAKQIYRQNTKYAFNLFDKTQRQLKNVVVNYIDQINESVKQQYEQAQNDFNGPYCELHDCSGKMYWNEHKKEILQRLKTDFSKEEWNNLNNDQKLEWLKQLLKEREFIKDIPWIQCEDA